MGDTLSAHLEKAAGSAAVYGKVRRGARLIFDLSVIFDLWKEYGFAEHAEP